MPEWTTARIADLGTVITGATPSSSDTEAWGDATDFITPTDQSNNRTARPSRRLSASGTASLRNRLLPAGATCFTCIGSTIGKVTLTDRPAVTNQQINSVVPNGNTDPLFVYYLLRFYADS
ncbi:restriction endonuclease subunit S, partial [Micromonospora chalcea]